MSSLKQIEANRQNAKKSTGPRTEVAKAISAQNALKTGLEARSLIIKGESESGLDQLITEYQTRFHPPTPEERYRVDTLISADWLRRRLLRVEQQLWALELREPVHREMIGLESGIAFNRGTDRLMLIQRRLDATQRNYHRALNELERIQKNRPAEAEAPA